LNARYPQGFPLVYADSIGNRGGTGVYTRRLLAGFRDMGTDVLAVVGGRVMSPGEALQSRPFTGTTKVLWENVLLPVKSAEFRPSLVHLPAFSGRGCSGAPVAVTLHDLAFIRNPRWFSPLKSMYYRLRFGKVAGTADVIMADSRFTAKEAESLLSLDPSKIRVVYLCTERFEADGGEKFRKWAEMKGEYCVHVGTIEPRKNVSALLDAWKKVRKVHGDMALVLAGRWGRGPSSLKNRLSREPGVFHVGELEGGMLKSCVSGAKLLICSSFYEGFGLPPMEAASAGVPSVVTPADALVEIYGEIATIADDFGADGISGAILSALDTPGKVDRLKEFADEFTVERMVSEVIRVYGEFARE